VLHWPKNITLALCAGSVLALTQPHLHAAESGADQTFLALRDAARKDKVDKAAELAARLKDYPIPSYVEYYRLKPRVKDLPHGEIRAFLNRHAGTAIADRLRNDWLLELGKRRDWARFDEQYPQFVLKDDVQVTCYALLSRAVKGQPVAAEAREALTQPKKYGEGCVALIATLAKNGQFTPDDVWFQIRQAAEYGSSGVAERLAPVVGADERQVGRAADLPLLTLARGAQSSRAAHETFIIALGRLARKNHEQAAAYVLQHAVGKLSAQEQELAWSQIALRASFSLAPEALSYWKKAGNAPLSDEGHQWKVRAALRAGDWKMVQQAIDAMPAALQRDPAWIYWKGRALATEGQREQARKLFQSISHERQFYGQLALEELGQKITIPPRAKPVSEAELAPMAHNGGFARARKLYELDLRFDGGREWNWELRRMNDRELLAAAEFARKIGLLDRMVNSSDRTKHEFDFTQRFPTPHRKLMQDATGKLGLDMAWSYGLIRQESRFIMHARSSVGASGLMQLMPATAKYVARKIGLGGFNGNDVNDPQTNITLGTNYLKMVLDQLDGSQAMASAAYNAGPKRPKNWRTTLPWKIEGAIFAETIPFSETRGYVKNVLSNATYYAALFEDKPQSLKARLGSVTPR